VPFKIAILIIYSVFIKQKHVIYYIYIYNDHSRESSEKNIK